MIHINAPIKRDEVKRVIKATLGEVEVFETRMPLKTMEDDTEKFDLLKKKLKENKVTKILFMSVKLE